MAGTKTEEDQGKAKNRLVDIQVHEVSLVDLAANKRRYLLTKRNNMIKLVADGRGGFKEVDVDKNGDPTGEAAAKSEKPKAEASEEASKGGDDDKAKAEAEKAKKAEAEKAKGSEDDGKVIQAKLAATAERLVEVAESGNIPENFAEEIGKMVASATESISKAKRMGKTRLDSLKKAIETLSSLLKELDAGDVEEEGTAQKATKAAKSEADEALAKRVEELETELKKFREQPNDSNAIATDVDKAADNSKKGDTTWPLDLNNEITKESAEKRGIAF